MSDEMFLMFMRHFTLVVIIGVVVIGAFVKGELMMNKGDDNESE